MKMNQESGNTMTSTIRVPKTTLPGTTRADLEKLGFRFGADVDDLTMMCDLPSGWSVQGIDAEWFAVLDGEGRRRVEALIREQPPQARRSHIGLLPRYRTARLFLDDAGAVLSEDALRKNWNAAVQIRVVAIDHDGAEIHVVGTIAKNEQEAEYALETQAREWLLTNYPNCLDPLAYWD
jgi:hypothetical protein